MAPRKIFVFALPRSGSTLLCDLLSVPGRGVILHEPMILRRFGDGREHRIVNTLAAIGIHLDGSLKSCTPGQLAQPWYDQYVIPQLAELDYWGIKEVFLEDASQLVDEYSPDQIVLLWRDPKDVSLSLLELMNRALMSFSDRKTLKDEAWAFECVRASATNLTLLAQNNPHMQLKYEDLIMSRKHQLALLDYVGIDAFSDVSLALADHGSSVRTPEVRLHQDRLSTKSLNRFNREPPGWRRTFANVCHAAIADESNSAGYLRPSLSFEECCATPLKSAIQRLADPNYDPGRSFDFSYARRRARRKVLPLLAPGKSVLDIGSATAALAFLAPDSKVTVVDDGAPGKRVLSKAWRQGVLPQLDRFDTATLLFALEFIAEPLRMVHSLLDRGLNVIISYHCVDDFPMNRRIALQFTSHLHRADWTNFASSQSVKIECEWAFDGFQSQLVLYPRNTSVES